MASVILKPNRDSSLRRRHPWIFSGAVKDVKGNPGSGETVDVLGHDGQWLASGAYSPVSQIRVRVWTFSKDEEAGPSFFSNRLERSIKARDSINFKNPAAALRLVNAESDSLPGLIVDRYADFLVCQFLSAGTEFWKKEIVKGLEGLLPSTGIYERSDSSSREKEGLAQAVGLIAGQEPPGLVEIDEGPLRFLVDVRRGHKTGFYLDQRENRAMVPEFSEGAYVLNCFSYSGGFGLMALKGGAKSLTNIDASSEALDLARRNMELNRVEPGKCENLDGDVFNILREFRDAGRSFGLIILDPPKFAESVNQVDRACRGYKDINLLAFKLLKPGGVLFTFSCSGHVGPALFQKVVADAALDAGRDAQIIRYLGQAADHPIGLQFPEGQYLKGLICKAL